MIPRCLLFPSTDSTFQFLFLIMHHMNYPPCLELWCWQCHCFFPPQLDPPNEVIIEVWREMFILTAHLDSVSMKALVSHKAARLHTPCNVLLASHARDQIITDCTAWNSRCYIFDVIVITHSECPFILVAFRWHFSSHYHIEQNLKSWEPVGAIPPQRCHTKT